MKNLKQKAKRVISLIAMIALAVSVVLVPGMVAKADPAKTLAGPPAEQRTMLSPPFSVSGLGEIEMTFEVTPAAGFGTGMSFCTTYFLSNDPTYKPTNVATLNRTAFRFYTDDDISYYPALHTGATRNAVFDRKFAMTEGTKYNFKINIDFNKKVNSLYVKKAGDDEYTVIAVERPFYLNGFAQVPSNSAVNVIFTDHTAFPWKNLTIKEIVKTPKATLQSGTYAEAKTIQISCDTPNASIYYTTNGTKPTVNSTLYTTGAAINITGKTFIKAAAVINGIWSEVAEFDYDVVPTHIGMYGVDKYATEYRGSTVYNNPIVQAQYAADDVNKMLIYPLGESYSGNVLINFDLTMTQPYGTFSIGFGEYNHSLPSKNTMVVNNFQDYRKTYANIFYRPVQGIRSQVFCARQSIRPPADRVSNTITATGADYYYLNRVAYDAPVTQVPVKVQIDTVRNVYSYWVNGTLVAKDYVPLVAPLANVGVMGVNTRLNDVTIEI